jgi:hypothetical protein
MDMELCMSLFDKDVIHVLQSIHLTDTSKLGQIAGASAFFFEKMQRYYYLMVED